LVPLAELLKFTEKNIIYAGKGTNNFGRASFREVNYLSRYGL